MEIKIDRVWVFFSGYWGSTIYIMENRGFSVGFLMVFIFWKIRSCDLIGRGIIKIRLYWIFYFILEYFNFCN